MEEASMDSANLVGKEKCFVGLVPRVKIKDLCLQRVDCNRKRLGIYHRPVENMKQKTRG
jgi:hypothetical protein